MSEGDRETAVRRPRPTKAVKSFKKIVLLPVLRLCHRLTK